VIVDTAAIPPGRFLISTHYVKYDPRLFFINFAACVFVLFPKLPAVSLSLSFPQSSKTGCLSGAELTILPDPIRAASRQQLHRLRFHFTPLENKPVASNGVTPNPSRPGSPHPPGLRMSTLDPIMESRKA
jgi:hypothetical protein